MMGGVHSRLPQQSLLLECSRNKNSVTWKRRLLASISTASCSSPNELMHAVPPQEAVLTLKAMVLNASPMHIINLISPLSGVDFVRNSSYEHTVKTSKSFPNFNIFLTEEQKRKKKLLILCSYHIKLTRLSPISHLVIAEVFFVLEALRDDFGTTRNGSPKSELNLRLCISSLAYP